MAKNPQRMSGLGVVLILRCSVTYSPFIERRTLSSIRSGPIVLLLLVQHHRIFVALCSTIPSQSDTLSLILALPTLVLYHALTFISFDTNPRGNRALSNLKRKERKLLEGQSCVGKRAIPIQTEPVGQRPETKERRETSERLEF